MERTIEDIKETSFFVSVIFEEQPEQWGFRGDPYLWEEMRKEFSKVPMTISSEDFVKEFKAIFEKLTGNPLTSKKDIFLLKYAHGGMSSGRICGEFWNKKVLPMLVDRLMGFK